MPDLNGLKRFSGKERQSVNWRWAMQTLTWPRSEKVLNRIQRTPCILVTDM